MLALNPWALVITGVIASGAIIYKTWSDTQANLERGYEDMRRKALQKDNLVSMARRWVSVGLGVGTRGGRPGCVFGRR